MADPDLDFQRVEDRLRRFLGRPAELAGAAALCALLAGALPYAHRDNAFNASVSRYGFDGFVVLGFILYATVLAYGLAFLSRHRPHLGLPRLWCDRASFWLTLFALVRTYVFLEQVEVSSGGFFFFGWSSSVSFSMGQRGRPAAVSQAWAEKTGCVAAPRCTPRPLPGWSSPFTRPLPGWSAPLSWPLP